MSKNFSQKLKLRGFPDHLAVQGIGGSKSVSRRRVQACILPRFSESSSYNEEMSFYILPDLTASLPLQRVSLGQWKPPSIIMLADPQFCEPGHIDIIIGAEHFYNLLIDGRVNICEDGPTLQNTVFGWIVSGSVPIQSANPLQAVSFPCTVADIHGQQGRPQELKFFKPVSIQSVEGSTCDTIFDDTAARDSNGKFVPSLSKKKRLWFEGPLGLRQDPVAVPRRATRDIFGALAPRTAHRTPWTVDFINQYRQHRRPIKEPVHSRLPTQESHLRHPSTRSEVRG